jgi:hypothetical protein
MTSGLNFINNNNTELSANDNMPSIFATEFKDLKTEFFKQHQLFLDAEENSSIGQDKKITANNNIFANLMSMLLDGQEIFKSDEALVKQFIFTELLYLASGSGTAGIKGHFYNSITELPISTGKVSILGTTKSTIVDDLKGAYEINQVAAGIYNITAESEGYESQTVTGYEIKTGTVSTLNFKLKLKI